MILFIDTIFTNEREFTPCSGVAVKKLWYIQTAEYAAAIRKMEELSVHE